VRSIDHNLTVPHLSSDANYFGVPRVIDSGHYIGEQQQAETFNTPVMPAAWNFL